MEKRKMALGTKATMVILILLGISNLAIFAFGTSRLGPDSWATFLYSGVMFFFAYLVWRVDNHFLDR